ncbi:MAG: energy-coupling factor transporter transmembrane protein EcfT [Firmicutes bacterium]|nr:energy-coupling factor transporter transmembrane protein EcfT [Bacillota bacterium]
MFNQELDPRSVLTFVLVVTSLAIYLNQVFWLGGLFLFVLILLALGRVQYMRLLRRARRFAPLLLGLLVIQSLAHSGGSVLVQIGDFRLLTVEGVWAAFSVLLRLLIIVGAVMLLNRKDPQQIAMGLIKWKVPYELAFMVLLAMRFLPVLTEEFQDALTAVQLRGVELANIPLGQKLRIYNYILLPVVAGAVLRARRVATAMEARAFRAYPRRTYLEPPILRTVDYLIIFGSLLGGLTLMSIYRGWL